MIKDKKIVYEEINTYDDENRLVYKKQKFSNKSEYYVIYDKNGNIIEKKDIDGDLSKIKYNENNVQIEKLIYSKDDNYKEPYSIRKVIFNNNNKGTHIIVNKDYFMESYAKCDEHGNILHFRSRIIETGERDWFKAKYNNNNRIIFKREKYNKTLNEWEYDEQNRMIYYICRTEKETEPLTEEKYEYYKNTNYLSYKKIIYKGKITNEYFWKFEEGANGTILNNYKKKKGYAYDSDELVCTLTEETFERYDKYENSIYKIEYETKEYINESYKDKIDKMIKIRDTDSLYSI